MEAVLIVYYKLYIFNIYNFINGVCASVPAYCHNVTKSHCHGRCVRQSQPCPLSVKRNLTGAEITDSTPRNYGSF